ncbi:hypothetical protein C6497_01005 [Candidatus Poribacteria bacterium]|nr:MAG: hypothetical protein C6497_01005 [Candidatus Poribacteria bacterium]
MDKPTTNKDTMNIIVNPNISPDELFTFYEKNNICEVGFGKEVASRILDHPHLIIAAYMETKLIGLARATFDGLSAHIMEFSIDIQYQGGIQKYNNGSLIEADEEQVGYKLGKVLISELEKMGATFITGYIVENCEESFYNAIGFSKNEGHLVYYIDKRPYTT